MPATQPYKQEQDPASEVVPLPKIIPIERERTAREQIRDAERAAAEQTAAAVAEEQRRAARAKEVIRANKAAQSDPDTVDGCSKYEDAGGQALEYLKRNEGAYRAAILEARARLGLVEKPEEDVVDKEPEEPKELETVSEDEKRLQQIATEYFDHAIHQMRKLGNTREQARLEAMKLAIGDGRFFESVSYDGEDVNEPSPYGFLFRSFHQFIDKEGPAAEQNKDLRELMEKDPGFQEYQTQKAAAAAEAAKGFVPRTAEKPIGDVTELQAAAAESATEFTAENMAELTKLADEYFGHGIESAQSIKDKEAEARFLALQEAIQYGEFFEPISYEGASDQEQSPYEHLLEASAVFENVSDKPGSASYMNHAMRKLMERSPRYQDFLEEKRQAQNLEQTPEPDDTPTIETKVETAPEPEMFPEIRERSEAREKRREIIENQDPEKLVQLTDKYLDEEIQQAEAEQNNQKAAYLEAVKKAMKAGDYFAPISYEYYQDGALVSTVEKSPFLFMEEERFITRDNLYQLRGNEDEYKPTKDKHDLADTITEFLRKAPGYAKAGLKKIEGNRRYRLYEQYTDQGRTEKAEREARLGYERAIKDYFQPVLDNLISDLERREMPIKQKDKIQPGHKECLGEATRLRHMLRAGQYHGENPSDLKQRAEINLSLEDGIDLRNITEGDGPYEFLEALIQGNEVKQRKPGLSVKEVKRLQKANMRYHVALAAMERIRAQKTK